MAIYHFNHMYNIFVFINKMISLEVLLVYLTNIFYFFFNHFISKNGHWISSLQAFFDLYMNTNIFTQIFFSLPFKLVTSLLQENLDTLNFSYIYKNLDVMKHNNIIITSYEVLMYFMHLLSYLFLVKGMMSLIFNISEDIDTIIDSILYLLMFAFFQAFVWILTRLLLLSKNDLHIAIIVTYVLYVIIVGTLYKILTTHGDLIQQLMSSNNILNRFFMVADTLRDTVLILFVCIIVTFILQIMKIMFNRILNIKYSESLHKKNTVFLLIFNTLIIFLYYLYTF